MTDIHAGPSFTARPVDPLEQAQAMRRLVGTPSPTAAQARYFDRVIDELGPERRWLWGSFDDQQHRPEHRMIAAVLIVPQAGRTGMVFASRPRHRLELAATSQLIDAAVRRAPTERVTLAQALLPTDETLITLAFEQARFQRLATLCYMQARVPRRAPMPDIPEGIQLETWRPALRSDFLAALEASYEQTLDCPALQGLRKTTDVLNGHMATGRFDPALWTLVRCDGRPAGAMLLNYVPAVGSVELVYLGLSPQLRGRGLGRMLLQRAMHLVSAAGHRQLMLAVDESNTPAVGLYRSHKFTSHARKLAMIRTIRG